ncbi:MAG TPA: hypothetical protein VFB41_07625 [Solirubrobacteraceae bacterium]|nr:hypothetical protein [Solirubrobacteraceae bacterium]
MSQLPDDGCIFCGSSPRTREHLWPDWLRRELAIDESFPHRIEQEEDAIETRDVTFSTPPFKQTVKAVCGPCNNGWMSDIEAATKPILEQLIYARGRRLHRAEQRKLATWALLKAIVFDHVHPNELTVAAEHRRYLHEHKQPPVEGVWVRLATYEASDVGHYAYQGIKLARVGHPAPVEPTIYFATITLGALVVQLSGSLLPEWSFAGVPYPPELNVAEIWPASASVEFDQHNVMTHDTLINFTKVLYNVVGRLSGGVPPPR